MQGKPLFFGKSSPEIAYKIQVYAKTNNPCGLFKILGKQELS